jgi:NAD(P)-dependent dehydrogenase (short-subunit alcohol dehydrogenase family)
MNPSSFTSLRVVVTGGTSGLGLALMQALTARGARVAFVARDAARVAHVAERFSGTHGITADVSVKADAHCIALQSMAALGGVDVLIHNASSLGPVPMALLADTACEDFTAALEVNVLGPFRLTKALLGALTASAREAAPARPSLVILISSDAAVTPYAGWGAYAASKAALLHMGRVWDEELRDHGVRVLSIDPGDMDTPLHALAVPDADPATLKRPEDAAQEVLTQIEEAIDAARNEVAA